MAENKNFPQSDALRAVADERAAIGDFLEWLSEQGIWLATVDTSTERLIPISANNETLTMRYFAIDTKALEAERREMLEDLRAGGF